MKSIATCLGYLVFMPVVLAQPIQEQLRVVFRDVRVHVTDSQGQPVTGLTAANFILKEDGQTQAITFFEEVDQRALSTAGEDDPFGEEEDVTKSPGASTATDEANIVIVLDSSNMRAEAFPAFKNIIADFIRATVNERTLVKLVQIEDRLIHLSPFLRNPNMLISALEKARYEGAQIRRLRAQESIVAHAFSRYLDPGYEPEEAGFFRQDKLYELREAVRRKQQIKRNHFLVFENGLHHIARVFDQMSGSKTVYLFSGGGFVLSKSLTKPTKSQSQDLGRILNSANLTIYSFLHAPRKSLFEDFAQTDLTNLRDQFNPLPELGSTYMKATDTILENAFDLTKAPLDATDSTGGVAKTLHRLSDIGQAFLGFNQSIRHYYRLGYTIEAPEKRTAVKIELAESSQKWKIHYGKHFNPIRSYLEMDEQERAVAFEASLVYSQSFRSDLDVTWGYQGFKGLNRGEAIPIYIQLNSARFSRKGYDVGFAALNDIRDLIDYANATVLHRGKGNKFLFYDVLLPRAKPHYLRFQIIDLETGDKSLYEMPYHRDTVDSNGFHVSGITLAHDQEVVVLPINHLREDPKPPEVGLSVVAMRRAYDPFTIGNRLFIPAMEQRFAPTDSFHLFFQLKRAEGKAEEYGITCTLSKDGKTLPCNLRVEALSQPQKQTFNCRGTLATDSLKPGLYTFALVVQRDDASEQASAIHQFRIE